MNARIVANKSLADNGATKASVLGVFEPITAILVGTLMFGEPLTTNIVLGIGIAIVAVIFMISITKR
ncbi:MAG: EamA family transporter [Clostridia bacterium]|nr:EamA family transporter [Clostridia bacterium]